MKIIIVTNNFPAPSETFITNKVLCLAKKQHKIVVFCNSFDQPAWLNMDSEKNDVVIEVLNKKKMLSFLFVHSYKIFSSLHNKILRAKIQDDFFVSLVNKHKADVIHFEFSGIGIHYINTFKKISAKKIVSCRGSAEKVKLLEDNNRKRKMKELFLLVNKIHCVSQDMRQTILPYCNELEKIFINYPSIDFNKFKRSGEYTIHKPFRILSVGRLTFQKGYLTGLLAVKKLKQKDSDFIWTIIGDGAQKEEILFHINEMNLGENVFLAGKKNSTEIVEFYNNHDVFFLPSFYEGISNAALEAMSMELPVIATRSGGMSEVITNNADGFLSEVYDFENMAEQLFQLINNYEFNKEIGKNARKRVIKAFNIEEQINKFEKIYHE